MEELKKLKLNNRSLEEFDKLMNYHLDKIEELERRNQYKSKAL